jgi:hypothetical protein
MCEELLIGQYLLPRKPSVPHLPMPSSSNKKPLVIVTRKLPDAIETRLMELFETRLNADDKPLTAAQLDRGGEGSGRSGADGDRPHRQPRAFSGRPRS